MINLSITAPGLDGLVATLHGIEAALVDLTPLGEKLKPVMVQDNLDAAVAGLDFHGQAYTDIKPATVKWRLRTGRGMGPPLAPDGSGSSIVGSYDVEMIETGPGLVTLLGEWSGAPWIKYHADGPEHSARLPVRDPLGIRPVSAERIEDELNQFVEALLTNRY